MKVMTNIKNLFNINPLFLPKNLFKVIKSSPDQYMGYKKLEQYGIIGNLETCALVGINGSIDWMCMPHLESPSIFCALLDKDKGGFFVVQPKGNFSAHQHYITDTNILETHFFASGGQAILTDFMPPFKKRTVWHKQQILFRKIKCTKGSLSFSADFRPRFSYARIKPKFKLTDTGVEAFSATEKIFLDSPFPFSIKPKDSAKANFTLSAGEEAWFTLQYNSHVFFSPKNAAKELTEATKFWQEWSHKCNRAECVFDGPWHDLVVRSGLVLKLLTHGETGAIAAAATTSLPETIGGVRNWDYRFNWIRDSVFTAQALYNLGNTKEAKELFNWYKRIYKNVKIKDIQILNGLHGEKATPEKILRHLSGHKNSKPVRIGNSAVGQFQLDVYGELLNIAYEVSRYGDGISKNDWLLQRKVVDYVCEVWKKPDAGIWEIRGKNKHFVYSKVMCWVAVDRALKIVERKGFEAPVEKWREVRDEIHKTVLEKGFDSELNSFVQSYGSKTLDASNLLIPIVGFLPFTDPRIQGTINVALKNLTKKGLVLRYIADDGLPGKEGGFVLCTNWLIDALTLSGRLNEAESLYKNLLKYASPLGLFAEEINYETKEQLGNFPQAFSHVGLINSALYIGLAKGKHGKEIKPFSFIKSIRQIKRGLFKTIKFLGV
jgi:GH15 family glucan-1,4-alpha-glucosidase